MPRTRQKPIEPLNPAASEVPVYVIQKQPGHSSLAITNRYVASGLAVLAIGYFALMPSAKSLWQLFGTTNQLLAGLALLAITTYIFKRGRPTLFFAAPMLFMFATAITAMGLKLTEFARNGQNQLFIVSLVILGLAVWLVIEAVIDYFASHRNNRKTIGV